VTDQGNRLEKYLIAGLGNPGAGYKKNRHNAGYIIVDEILRHLGISAVKKQYNAKVSRYVSEKGEHIFIKPLSFMNNSGIVVNSFLYKEKIPTQNLVVIYDDIDLPFGTIRYRDKGSAGTHNGMRSVISNIGTGDFKRIRIGIDKPEKGSDLAGYVLDDFSKDQMKTLKDEFAAEIFDKLFTGSIYLHGENK
jgi:PTH1 family peptidyl-tRNA hydrolase